jgi:hypothetical protein
VLKHPLLLVTSALLVLVAVGAGAWALTNSGASAQAIVTGNLDCSNVGSLAGYGGSPASLTLSAGTQRATLDYPSQLLDRSSNSVFGTPVLGAYRFAFPIAGGSSTIRVSWSLTCQSAAGASAGTWNGHFAAGGGQSVRDICNHGGVANPCNPTLGDSLGSCGFAIVTVGGGETLSLAADALSPPRTTWAKAQDALSEVSGPIGGVVLACASAGAQALSPARLLPGTSGSPARGAANGARTGAPPGGQSTSAAEPAASNSAGPSPGSNGPTQWEWTQPDQIDSHALDAVSCASSSICVAMDSHQGALFWNGSAWAQPVQAGTTGGGIQSLSCPTSTFCMATDGSNGIFTWTRSNGWSTQYIEEADDIKVVSCVSATLCAAGDFAGNLWTWDGSSWARGTDGSTGPVEALSCASSSFCLALSNGGMSMTWNGSTWSVPIQSPLDGPFSASCPSATFCMAVDQNGLSSIWQGGWAPARSVEHGSVESVSCPSTTVCMAVDAYGSAILWSGQLGWSAPAQIDQNGGGTGESVSCPSTNFCMATNESGDAIYGHPAS